MACVATAIARGWPPRGADTAPGAECQAVFSQVMFLHISKTLSESVRCLFFSDHNRRNTEKDRSPQAARNLVKADLDRMKQELSNWGRWERTTGRPTRRRI